ncbi:MAG TPA: hypothetical protein VHL09_01860 [Dehalococcoidia bacterium]|nr:hypothetical protein [Dehalococcoidia bacterium]
MIYDRGTGDLWYDPDGLGGAPGIKFAILPAGLRLSGSDLYIV